MGEESFDLRDGGVVSSPITPRGEDRHARVGKGVGDRIGRLTRVPGEYQHQSRDAERLEHRDRHRRRARTLVGDDGGARDAERIEEAAQPRGDTAVLTVSVRFSRGKQGRVDATVPSEGVE